MKVLAPLGDRNFRLLWAGKSVSLVGDGVFIVAIALQAYELSNSPTALGVSYLAWTLPTLLLLPFSGVLSDRVGRRPMMIAADLLRAGAVGLLAALSLSGEIELWHLFVLSAAFGLGDALFEPSFTAIVPEIVPQPLIVQANSLDQTMRPLAMQFAGPALGGLVVSVWSPGAAFLLDACSFLFSALMLALIRHAGPVERDDDEPALHAGAMIQELREGVSYVRAHAWLWGTLVAFCIMLLAFWGPYDVLLPYLIKNDVGGGDGGYGLVLAFGGVGAITAALLIGQTGLPRRRMTLLYVCSITAGYMVALFGVAGEIWHMAAISMVIGGCLSAAMIVWTTLMQTLVPSDLLARVSALDWMVSTALVPVSFGVVGPVADALGARETIILSGVISGSVLAAFYTLIPAMREVDRPA